MTWKNLLWGIAVSAFSVHAGAADYSYKPNAAEMQRMPPYCQVKWNFPPTSPEWKSWRDQIGSNYIDVHHFCAGLNFMNRYWGSRNARDRGFYLQSALNNFNYMAKAEKPDFALRAELYSHRGEVLRLMGRPGEAVNDYNKALSINPKMVKPYLQLADLNVAGKSPARALEAITQGLRHVPDSTALQRRYLELGGKKPFPEPIAIQAPEPAALPPAEVTQTPEAVDEAAPAQAAPAVAEPVGAATDAPQPVIGTPTNPYCRFCPPE